MPITYSDPPTTLPNTSRLHSVADGAAVAFGEIVRAGEIASQLRLAIPINAASVGGTYDIYLVESLDGTNWTDNIDPTADTGDVSAKIEDAKRLKSFSTVYNATNRAEVEAMLTVPATNHHKFIGFVFVNSSALTTPASGAAGSYVELGAS